MKTISKHFIALFSVFIILSSCSNKKADIAAIKEEIRQTEKDFSDLSMKVGISKAIYEYADDSATINRGNDKLYKGKEAIKEFYSDSVFNSFKLSWEPEFVGVSDDGSMAYTYGKYRLLRTRKDGTLAEYTGVFHTVWRKQADGSWKFVWD
ncbi:MAG: DUF4440 domain-containing protein [Bacteroidales bacterium]|nr:DUF4440 domain-containing protein [Bacteroidales bacterium]MCB9013963.1 DUF4440 domain-containing protein [Bacteroidales bacterium]